MRLCNKRVQKRHDVSGSTARAGKMKSRWFKHIEGVESIGILIISHPAHSSGFVITRPVTILKFDFLDIFRPEGKIPQSS